jgi:MFS transporter, ACS family, hexuronate transporter
LAKSIDGRLSWALFVILCVAGIFNAMDRPIIAILKPDMSADFGWSDADFGQLAFVTQMAAAFSFLFTGWLVDRLGVWRSMIAGVATWSLAAMAHGWAVSAWQVVAARVGLGATEAVQTPLTIKTVATLFPPNTRLPDLARCRCRSSSRSSPPHSAGAAPWCLAGWPGS